MGWNDTAARNEMVDVAAKFVDVGGWLLRKGSRLEVVPCSVKSPQFLGSFL